MPYTNALRSLEKLRPVFDEKQATAVADAIEQALQTNNDTLLDKLDSKLSGLETRLDSKLHEMETRFDSKLHEMETRFDSKLHEMETRFDSKLHEMETRLEARMDVKIADLRAELIKWMFIFWVGQVAVVFAIVKFVK